MTRKAYSFVPVPALLLAATASVSADDAPLDVNRFHPAMGNERIVTAELAEVGPRWQLVPQLFLHYADEPMVLTVGGDEVATLVQNRITGDFGVSLSLMDRLQIGLSFPVTISQGSEPLGDRFVPIQDTNNPPDEIASAGPEDLRLSLKGVLWRQGEWGVGLAGCLTAPTGDDDSYLGSKMPTFDARLIGHYRNGRLTAAASMGWLFASRERVLTTQTGQALTFGAGAEYMVYKNQSDLSVALGAELYGFAHSRFETAAEAPAEIALVAKSHYRQWTVFLGGGPGLTRGYGEPNVRVFLGASWSWVPPPKPPVPSPPPEPQPQPPGPQPPEPQPEPARWVDSTLTLPSGVLFEYDKCQIKPESFGELRKVAEALAANPEWGNVRIEGHASREQGKRTYNLRLSRCRAERVARFLAHHGVAKSRLTYLGFGYSCPRAPNDTEANRQKNRRVEFVRNPADNPPRCTVPQQLEPLDKHSIEPYLYETGGSAAPGQPGTVPPQPAQPSGTGEQN